MKSLVILVAGLLLGAGGLLATVILTSCGTAAPEISPLPADRQFKPRKAVDPKTFSIPRVMPEWDDPTSLESIRKASFNVGPRNLAMIDEQLRRGMRSEDNPGGFRTEGDK